MWRLERALAEICGLAHVSLQPSAGSHGELAGLLLTRAYHEDRGEERTQGADARHRPRDQPRLGDDGRLRGGQGGDRRARRRRPRRPALQGRRAGRLPDAHQPQHARAVRREHRRDHPDGPRRRRHPVLRRRQPERDHGSHAARRHGVRHRPREPPQVVLPAARRRRAGSGADRGLRSHRALPAGPAPGSRRGRRRRRPGVRPRSRAPEVDRPAARLCGQLRRLRPLLRLHHEPRRRRAHGGVGDRGAERQLPARPAASGARRASTCRSPSTACCMHEFVLSGAPGEARARRRRRSTSPSACSTSASTRRPSTSRCWSTRR